MIKTKRKIVIVIACCFMVIWIIITNIITIQLSLNKIYYRYISQSPLYCYKLTGQTLRDILEIKPLKGKSIFFHETSCKSYEKGKLVLEKRQACAIESAAKLNTNYIVYVLFTSPGIIKDEGTESDNILNALLYYENVNFHHVNFDNYSKGTPLETVYEMGHVEYSEYGQSHMSDLLRYLTLWKYGGIYLDLDVVVIKPFANLSVNFAGAESQKDVAAGVMGFNHEGVGHSHAGACLEDLKNNYKYDDWGYNGPGVITRLLKNLCNSDNVSDMIDKDCKGFKVYPPSYFYPIPWENWSMYFRAKDNSQVLNLSKQSYTIHVWNKLSSQQDIPLTSETSYTMFARKFCPKVYEASVGYF